jgi:multidrug efflux system membrane fusion protein
MRQRYAVPALLLVIVAGIAWVALFQRPWLGRPDAAPGGAAAAVPVIADSVRRADVPVYLRGLGTVRAFNSVLLKSRVDGEIVRLDFAEGQEVHAGDVLVEVDPQPFEAVLAQAEAAKLKDQAQLDNARLDLNRATRLVASGAGTTQQLDTTHALVAQLEASIKADLAMINTAQIQLNYSRIRSPFDGRTGTRLVDVGNIVRASDTTGIVMINQIHPISVDFALPASTLSSIRARLKAGDVPVTAQDSNGNDLATGRLAVIDNQVNVATSTVHYKATFDNADERLWPGQFVDVRLELEVRRGVAAVPNTAILHGPEGAYVFVIGANNVVRKRPVKVGFANSVVTVVDSGLEVGERVVIDGQYRIQAGTAVEILPPPQSAS